MNLRLICSRFPTIWLVQINSYRKAYWIRCIQATLREICLSSEALNILSNDKNHWIDRLLLFNKSFVSSIEFSSHMFMRLICNIVWPCLAFRSRYRSSTNQYRSARSFISTWESYRLINVRKEIGLSMHLLVEHQVKMLASRIVVLLRWSDKDDDSKYSTAFLSHSQLCSIEKSTNH